MVSAEASVQGELGLGCKAQVHVLKITLRTRDGDFLDRAQQLAGSSGRCWRSLPGPFLNGPEDIGPHDAAGRTRQ
jgi:hypothetical protein